MVFNAAKNFVKLVSNQLVSENFNTSKILNSSWKTDAGQEKYRDGVTPSISFTAYSNLFTTSQKIYYIAENIKFLSLSIFHDSWKVFKDLSTEYYFGV